MASALDRIAHAVEHIATIQGHRFNMEYRPLPSDPPITGGAAGPGGYAFNEGQHHSGPGSTGGGPPSAVETAAAPDVDWGRATGGK